MPTWPNATIAGPLGLQADPEYARVTTRVAVELGDLVMFDLSQSDADVSNGRPGNVNSVFTNVVTPATDGLTYGWFGVVTSLENGAGAADTEIVVCIRGRCKARVAGGGAAVLTDVLIAVNAADSLNTDAGAAGQKILGKPLKTTASGTAELIDILFEGIYGMGAADDQ